MNTNRTEMSQAAYDSLLHERSVLAREVLAARERVEHAQNGGGDSEGLEGVEAVFEADQISAKLATIDRLLTEAEIVQPRGETIQVGCTVVIDIGDGPETYSYEQVPGVGRLTAESPIGGAIAGRKVGDSVSVRTPGGELQVLIVDVS